MPAILDAPGMEDIKFVIIPCFILSPKLLVMGSSVPIVHHVLVGIEITGSVAVLCFSC